MKRRNTLRIYSVMHEHNYFYDCDKKKNRQPNEKEYLNHTEIITNDYDKCDSIPEWCTTTSSNDENYITKKKPRQPNEKEYLNHTEEIITSDYDECDPVPEWCTTTSSSDEDDDFELVTLSQVLEFEITKDFLHLYKKNKCVNGMLPLNVVNEDQMCNELNSTNNHDLSNISNGSNNIISENHVIDDGKQSKIIDTLVPLTNNAIIKSSLDSSNSLNIIDQTETVTPATYARPPLQWIHLLYLAIKNSAKENLTCFDIERKVREWFPYYCKKSIIKHINSILILINNCDRKYFLCNSFLICKGEVITWTVNSNYINTLENKLMTIVENNEDKIKSAMTHPDQLSTIVNGYGVLYLGCSQNSIEN